MSEVVKFLINTPVEVTLQDEAGKRVEGRYGDQVMYSLLDNRVMYVPPYVEQRFQELAIGAGEPLLLCKQQVKDSNDGPSGASRELRSNCRCRQTEPLLRIPSYQLPRRVCSQSERGTGDGNGQASTRP